MRVYESVQELDDVTPSMALTIGNFDGVHRGHRQLIAVARHAARQHDAGGVAAMTFHPHPLAILQPERAPGVLTPLPLKKRLLAEAGLDVLVVIRDDFSLLNLSPEEFVDRFLMEHLRPRILVEGPNFHFGYGRSGDIETLRALGAARGFGVVVVESTQIHDEQGHDVMCSSSRIRHWISQGDVAAAAMALGRPYRLMGTVHSGRGLGRALGFPTANVTPVEQVLPAEGVYAGRVQIGDSLDDVASAGPLHPAVFSVGRAKTFVQDHPLLLEAHVLEGDVGRLYDRWLAMDFVARIRNQRRFPDSQALAEQIHRDCKTAREVLDIA